MQKLFSAADRPAIFLRHMKGLFRNSFIACIMVFALTPALAQQGQTDSTQRPAPVQVQAPDTLGTNRGDSLTALRRDSFQLPVIAAADPVRRHEWFQQMLRKHWLYNFSGKPLRLDMQERNPRRDEFMFYLLLALVFYYALIRALFARYHANLFTLFFRATLRQQQLREQLLQTPLPSLLLNILFILSGALYMAFLARHYAVAPHLSFWRIFAYSVGGLALIYTAKFLILKTVGWIIRMHRATDAYIFVVFMVNKVAGIFLLPVLLFFAFPYPDSAGVVVPVSLFALLLLLGYRFLISYRQVRSEIKVNPFHFFIYLCAFEIAPLLLIYKGLLLFVERSN